ncbi:hypothetical protein PUNSTDRAFT_62174, partial [Punctularia strigosozonata HHB-11173 SS5]|uniref:uncharacterized protein n=1 Tax=Punctularia strigosozonata (strain HHB-11173) TaxID=741275 RepID=UPI0004417A33
DEMVQAIRSLSSPLTSSMVSERSVLSGQAIELVETLASNMGSTFIPLIPIFLPVLLNLCARPNKLFVTRARSCIIAIVEETQSPLILTFLVASLRDKAVSVRLSSLEAVFACVNTLSPSELCRDARAREVETAIRLTAKDCNADVRKISRKVFEAYGVVLPDRVPRYVYHPCSRPTRLELGSVS